MPEQLVDQAQRHPQRAKDLLDRLFGFDPAMATVYLAGILASFDRDNKIAKSWRAYARGRRLPVRPRGARARAA